MLPHETGLSRRAKLMLLMALAIFSVAEYYDLSKFDERTALREKVGHGVAIFFASLFVGVAGGMSLDFLYTAVFEIFCCGKHFRVKDADVPDNCGRALEMFSMFVESCREQPKAALSLQVQGLDGRSLQLSQPLLGISVVSDEKLAPKQADRLQDPKEDSGPVVPPKFCCPTIF